MIAGCDACDAMVVAANRARTFSPYDYHDARDTCAVIRRPV